MRPWDAGFLVSKYLRCTFLHIFAHFCTFLHTVCTWDTRTPAIKYWPSTTRIFYSWTLYYIALTLQYTILSYTSFSIPQKTCISRPYCILSFFHTWPLKKGVNMFIIPWQKDISEELVSKFQTHFTLMTCKWNCFLQFSICFLLHF